MKKKHLLYIDHNDFHYQLLCGVLGSSSPSFHITRIADATQARKMFGSRRFDLVLTEFEPPGTGGEWIRELKRCVKGLPVVVLSSLTDQGKAVQSIKMGAEDFIVKNRKNLRNLRPLLVRILAKKRKKEPSAQFKVGTVNRLMKNLKNMVELINDPAKSFEMGKNYLKQIVLLESELERIKTMMKNWVS